MTSRERIEAAFAHREPDRTPMFEYVLLSPVADQILGRPYAADDSHWPDALRELGWEAAVRQSVVDRLDLAEALGHDMLYAVPNPMPPADPAPLAASPEPAPDDPVERVALRNEHAAAASPHMPDDCLLVYRLLREEMDRRGMDLPILAPAYAHGIWTDADLMQTMALAPEVAHEHFRQATRRALAWVDRYVELGIEMMGVGGDFAGNRPLISPASYRTFIMPEVCEVSRRAHEAGRWAVNASDGNLWSVADDFLLGCEVDAYLEIDLHAGMDLRRLKSEYGGRVTLFGNLDCGNTLSFGTEAEVRAHVLECVEAGLGAGGHILCASNAITASVPLGNYLTVVNTYRERFGLQPIAVP